MTPAPPVVDGALLTSEETPLLSGKAAAAVGDDEDPRRRSKWRVLVGAFVVLFLIELADGISTPAWNALLEKGLCAEAHPDIASFLAAGDENPLCKDRAVQGKLALYRGWAYTLDCLPTILLALPLGSLSDRWGRKPIAILSVVGIILGIVWYEVVFYFPLPMCTFTLGFVFNLIGDGSAVGMYQIIQVAFPRYSFQIRTKIRTLGMSMIYTMLADVLHVEEMWVNHQWHNAPQLGTTLTPHSAGPRSCSGFTLSSSLRSWSPIPWAASWWARARGSLSLLATFS